MTPAETTRRLKAAALALGFDAVGVARADRSADADLLADWIARGRHGTMRWMEEHLEKRVDPRALVPGCRSVVAVALSYRRPADAAPHPPGVRVAQYAWGEDYHVVMKEKLRALLDAARAIDPALDGRAFVDSAPVLDRYWAIEAGLGWRGKNTNLLNRDLGSFVFLGTLLLTTELVPDSPATEHCGTCTRCLDACPTGALDAPYALDATKCIAYWTIEHRGDLTPEQEIATGEWLFGCDVCQDVCPWNTDAPEATEPRLAPRAEAWPSSLDEVLTMTSGEFRRRFGDTPIERTRRRGLVRNAAIVAGNAGLGSAEAVAAAAGERDPVVGAAAGRAMVRRGQC